MQTLPLVSTNLTVPENVIFPAPKSPQEWHLHDYELDEVVVCTQTHMKSAETQSISPSHVTLQMAVGEQKPKDQEKEHELEQESDELRDLAFILKALVVSLMFILGMEVSRYLHSGF